MELASGLEGLRATSKVTWAQAGSLEGWQHWKLPSTLPPCPRAGRFEPPKHQTTSEIAQQNESAWVGSASRTLVKATIQRGGHDIIETYSEEGNELVASNVACAMRIELGPNLFVAAHLFSRERRFSAELEDVRKILDDRTSEHYIGQSRQ